MDEKYYCRECQGKRNHKSVANKEIRGSNEYDFHWFYNYLIIQCDGCETISFLKIYTDSEMSYSNEFGELEQDYSENIYPYFLEGGRELDNLHYLPKPIKDIYVETISAFKANAYLLTAAGFRAVIEAICNNLKIKKEDLAKRLDLLHIKGFLSFKESKRLHSIRFLGNDALHEIATPEKEQLLIILEIINHLIENLYVHDKKMEGKVDKLIDNYDDFISLLISKITNKHIGNTFTLNQLLGKSKLVIKAAATSIFTDQLIKEVETNVIDFISIVELDGKKSFKIEKMPLPDYPF